MNSSQPSQPPDLIGALPASRGLGPDRGPLSASLWCRIVGVRATKRILRGGQTVNMDVTNKEESHIKRYKMSFGDVKVLQSIESHMSEPFSRLGGTAARIACLRGQGTLRSG